MWQQRSRHVQLGQLRCAGITPFSRDALSEVTREGRDYLRSAMSWPRAGTQSITQCDLVRADNIWGLWNCYSVIRVMVCDDEGMKILILTRDDEDMDTWSY